VTSVAWKSSSPLISQGRELDSYADRILDAAIEQFGLHGDINQTHSLARQFIELVLQSHGNRANRGGRP
jgi:hypothetical protein